MRALPLLVAVFLTSSCGSSRGAGGPRSLAARARLAAVSASETPRVARFLVDRVPVTEREYDVFLAETSRARGASSGDVGDPAALRARRSEEGRVRYRAHPAVLVAWDEARDYCAWRGARLLTEDEWQRAAQGTDGRAFPWGDRVDAARVNSAEGGANDTVPVLTHPRDASPFDVHDLSGNAAEWTSTAAEAPDHFVVRGSGWDEPAAAGTTTRRRAMHRATRSLTLTFRCATTP